MGRKLSVVLMMLFVLAFTGCEKTPESDKYPSRQEVDYNVVKDSYEELDLEEVMAHQESLREYSDYWLLEELNTESKQYFKVGSYVHVLYKSSKNQFRYYIPQEKMLFIFDLGINTIAIVDTNDDFFDSIRLDDMRILSDFVDGNQEYTQESEGITKTFTAGLLDDYYYTKIITEDRIVDYSGLHITITNADTYVDLEFGEETFEGGIRFYFTLKQKNVVDTLYFSLRKLLMTIHLTVSLRKTFY